MKIKVITTDKEFDSVKEEWMNFEKAVNNKNISSSYLSQRTWWKHFGKVNNNQFGFNKRLCIIFLYDDGNNLRAIAPFCEVKRKLKQTFWYTTIEFIAQQFGGCYIDIVSNSLNKKEINFIFGWLKKNRKYDLIYLRYIPEFTKNFNLRNNNVTILSACPEINISEYADINNYKEKNYDANFKRNLRKRNKRLNTNYNAEFIIKDKNIVDTDDWKYIIKISSSKVKDNKHSHYNDENKKQYCLDLFITFKDSFLIFLNINKIPVAYQICIPYNNKNFFIDFSYNREYRSYGIGNLVENFTIEDSFKKNYHICLGTGVDYHKLKFTKSIVKIYTVFKYGNTLKGLFIYKRKLEISRRKEKEFSAELKKNLPNYDLSI